METGRSTFQILMMDVSDVHSVRSAIRLLPEPVDALIMNAGGMAAIFRWLSQRTGVTRMFATNVLGHVALLEGLIGSGQLSKAAVLLGSEAARRSEVGPEATSPRNVFCRRFRGDLHRQGLRWEKFDSGLAYGEVKYVGAMWMAALARSIPL